MKILTTKLLKGVSTVIIKTCPNRPLGRVNRENIFPSTSSTPPAVSQCVIGVFTLRLHVTLLQTDVILILGSVGNVMISPPGVPGPNEHVNGLMFLLYYIIILCMMLFILSLYKFLLILKLVKQKCNKKYN